MKGAGVTRSEPPPTGRAIVFAISGCVQRAGIGGLCDSFSAALAGCDSEIVLCDVKDLGRADAVVVDALARLQLTARRLGRQIWLVNADEELYELLELVGLADVIPRRALSCGESERQPEQREELLSVEEESDSGDAIVRDV